MPRALDDLARQLAEKLPGRVERAAPSAEMTTYRCGGALAILVRAASEEHLRTLADVLGDADTPVLVVGRGSNLLVADTGFAGVAVALEGEFEHLDVDRRRAHVRAGAAVALPVLARRCAAVGVGGLEFYVGIPGSVGGAVRMNAGGHGAQTADVLTGARLVELGGGRAREVTRADLALGYRSSRVPPGAVVVAATFAGRPDDPAACGERIDEIVRWRRANQPGGQNAGSVFTNPPGDSAGRLIDATGCKGLRVGGAVVSAKHANFFVADEDASAADVVALVELVRDRVLEATGVRLETELHLVGFGGGHAD